MIEIPLTLAIAVVILAVVVAYLAFNAIRVDQQITMLWQDIVNLSRGRGLTTSKTSMGSTVGRKRMSKGSVSLKDSSEGFH